MICKPKHNSISEPSIPVSTEFLLRGISARIFLAYFPSQGQIAFSLYSALTIQHGRVEHLFAHLPVPFNNVSRTRL